VDTVVEEPIDITLLLHRLDYQTLAAVAQVVYMTVALMLSVAKAAQES
jgi:hypothetical protein